MVAWYFPAAEEWRSQAWHSWTWREKDGAGFSTIQCKLQLTWAYGVEALVSWRCLRKCIPIESWNDKWKCQVEQIRTPSETFPWYLSRLQARRLVETLNPGVLAAGDALWWFELLAVTIIIWPQSHPIRGQSGKGKGNGKMLRWTKHEKQQHPWEKIRCALD